MNEHIAQQLELIKTGILETVPVEAIYLFGSHAYGTAHEDSDLDIYVVLPDDVQKNPIELSGEIYYDLYYNKNLSSPMDIMVGKSSAFNRRKLAPTLQRTIAQKGVLLYGQ